MSLHDDLQFLHNRIDTLAEHSARLEGLASALETLLFSLIASHPNPKDLLDSFHRTSSIAIANSHVHAEDDAWSRFRGDEKRDSLTRFGEVIRSLAQE
jgi:hypothetical protein